MFKRLPFPWAYMLLPLVVVPLFTSFYLVVACIAATPAEQLRASGASIPAGWEAAVPNHGGYLRGYLFSTHPLLLAAALLGIVVFGAMARQLSLAQSEQLQTAGPDQAFRHKVAAVATFVATSLVVWLQTRVILLHFATT